LGAVLGKMDGVLGNLGKYMDKIKDSYDVLKKTEERRRLM
jgi:hypothetical protein